MCKFVYLLIMSLPYVCMEKPVWNTASTHTEALVLTSVIIPKTPVRKDHLSTGAAAKERGVLHE